MNQLYPYVIVEDVQGALNFYTEVFGGTTKILNAQEGRVLHAELFLANGGTLHFSATFGHHVTVGDSTRVMVQFTQEEEIRSIYEALAKEGKTVVELQDTFFGALHGQIQDKYNIHWVLNFFKKQG